MPEDDAPDVSIWHNPARLEEWFQMVKSRRNGAEPVPQADEDSDMTGNALTRELLGDRYGD